jgi:S-adenosylmethionine:tRNA ribosyltransferase-isomerase
MKVSDFDFELDPERIAQSALEPRDAARLLAHDLAAGTSEHLAVRDLASLLTCGDLVVVNDTRVRSARLFARRASGGAVELLLVERLAPDVWRALVRPAARIRPGEVLEIEGGGLIARALERDSDGVAWRVDLTDPRGSRADVDALIERFGQPPLPPYIHRPREAVEETEHDRERYQTIFAREVGAVAAPTAGLHFTQRLVDELAALGVEFARVTLHVGEGTFKPVSVDDTREHVMHAERFTLPQETVDALELCRARGGRVLAVGTTSVRVLESCADERGHLRAQSGETRLFLTPGAPFRVVDALLTNFHLPRSTLLMLVAAFAGRERVLRLYAEAIERGYRFYSYGDAMLLHGRERDV